MGVDGLHGHLQRVGHFGAADRHRGRHAGPQIGRRLVDADVGLVFLHVRLPPAGRLGVLIDFFDRAVQHAVAEADRADRGRQARPNVLDQRFVDRQVDAHRIGVRQTDDRLPLADDRAFLDDEFLVAAAVHDVGVFHDAVLRAP